MDRNSIRDTASSLFQRLSLAKTSVSDIARACDTGKGTIYQFFRSKDEIFEAIIEERLRIIELETRSFFENPSISLSPKLAAFFERLIDEYFHLKDLMFGDFENVEGRMLKDIFFKYGRHYEWSVDRLCEIVSLHEPYSARPQPSLRADIALVMEFAVGRALFWLVARDWHDREGLKKILGPLSERLFDAFVIKKQEEDMR